MPTMAFNHFLAGYILLTGFYDLMMKMPLFLNLIFISRCVMTSGLGHGLGVFIEISIKSTKLLVTLLIMLLYEIALPKKSK